MVCSSCGVENLPGAKFCHECGHPLTRGCPGCGSPVLPQAKLCSECGMTLSAEVVARPDGLKLATAISSSATGSGAPPSGQMGTELRLVSVLFCDLVGFTPLSEARDPEEVRELLTGYFDLALGI